MNKSIIPLILVNVLMTSLAQVALKAGMSTPGMSLSFASGQRVASAIAVLTTPMVFIGLTIYFLSALLWLVVLSRVDVSFAYPFVGLGFIVTMLLGWLVQGELLSVARIAGTLLIALGVAVVALGK